jgi:hypothetical protein
MKVMYLTNSVIAIFAFACGTIYGFREGINNYYNLNSLPEAVIGVAYFKQLENGDFKRAQGFYELKVDVALDSYIWYEENGNSLLSNIFLPELITGREESLKKLVEFRKNVPENDFSKFLEGEVKEKYLSMASKRNALIVSKGDAAKP